MEIIHKGKDPAVDVKVRLSCSNCSTVVEVKSKEFQYLQGDRPCDAGSHYVNCPVCSKMIFNTASTREAASWTAH